MPYLKELKTFQDLVSLKFKIKRDKYGKPVLRNGKKIPIKIGEGYHGKIFLGRIRFKNGKAIQVAIKRFNPGMMNADIAKKYRQVIADLRSAGVSIPTMGMVKLKSGEYVQVSRAFYNKKVGSKIYESSQDSLPNSKRNRLEAITELTKIANAGYFPFFDVIELFKDPKKYWREPEKGVIPLDLHVVVEHGKTALSSRVKELAENIELFSHVPSERHELFEAAKNVASVEMRKALERKQAQFKSKGLA